MTEIICNSIEEFKQKFKEIPMCPEYYTRIIFPVGDLERALIGVNIVDGIEGGNSTLPLIEYHIFIKLMLILEEENLRQIYDDFGNKLDAWVKTL